MSQPNPPPDRTPAQFRCASVAQISKTWAGGPRFRMLQHKALPGVEWGGARGRWRWVCHEGDKALIGLCLLIFCRRALRPHDSVALGFVRPVFTWDFVRIQILNNCWPRVGGNDDDCKGCTCMRSSKCTKSTSRRTYPLCASLIARRGLSLGEVSCLHPAGRVFLRYLGVVSR